MKRVAHRFEERVFGCRLFVTCYFRRLIRPWSDFRQCWLQLSIDLGQSEFQLCGNDYREVVVRSRIKVACYSVRSRSKLSPASQGDGELRQCCGKLRA